jgi:hypothetical protein
MVHIVGDHLTLSNSNILFPGRKPLARLDAFAARFSYPARGPTGKFIPLQRKVIRPQPNPVRPRLRPLVCAQPRPS